MGTRKGGRQCQVGGVTAALSGVGWSLTLLYRVSIQNESLVPELATPDPGTTWQMET